MFWSGFCWLIDWWIFVDWMDLIRVSDFRWSFPSGGFRVLVSWKFSLIVMAKSDHCVLVEWCASVNWKFNELERSLIKWKLKLATLVLQSGEENKTWIYLSLKDIREESSDIVRLMNLIRSSLADKEPTSDYYKFGMDELKYFTYDWEFTFQPEIEKIFNQHEQLIDKKAKKSTGSLMDNQIALR